ncbi:Rqc2 family fibronectin-binding protein, partial [Porcincola intestinalis]
NYYDGGKDLKIQLDSTLTAQENAQRYFDKYARQKRTAEALTVQIEQTESEVRQLEAISTFLDQAETEADLAQIREELEQSDYVRKRTVTGKKKGSSRTKKSEPYHFRTPDGYDIYVGKNNLQNDELTFRFASGGDWWFHAKKIPGSHVIVKTRGTEELPDDVFEMAAGAAAYYSQGRGADKVEIDYVKKKEVKKPGGAKPGFVVYYTNYSMIARPDISKLTLVE